MIYPYSLLRANIEIASLLGKPMGEPEIFDFSGANDQLWTMDVQDQRAFQEYTEERMNESGRQWGIAGYLEKRESLLRDLPQMVEEERFFHLGVDVLLPKDSQLFAPLTGIVTETGYEEGKGNFGGYILLLHHEVTENAPFYSLWGHLSPESLPEKGSHIEHGAPFARLGDYNRNGDWFYHTHLQILTEKGYSEGYIHKGYCTEKMLSVIDQYCPSPLFLLKW